MKRFVMAASLALAAMMPLAAQAASDEQDLVNSASATLDHVQRDPAFGDAQQLMRHAKAVLIIPNLIKGGFFIGGEEGTGVLLTRQYHGWSNPAFYTMGSASFGLQIGGQDSQIILIIMTDRAKRALMQDRFKIGADAGLTVVTLGSNAEAATTAQGGDIIAWASSKGAYAGLTINGSVIEPRESYDRAYYGRKVSSYGIVTLNQVNNPGDYGLRQKLARIAGP